MSRDFAAQHPDDVRVASDWEGTSANAVSPGHAVTGTGDEGDTGPGSGPVCVADDGDAVVLSIRESLAVHHARRLHEVAVGLVNRGAAVTVNCEAAEHLHLSAVQILLLLKRELAGVGRDVTFVGLSDPVLRCLTAAGLVTALQP